MTYKGHTENGVIVLDDPVSLKNGLKVAVEVLEDSKAANPSMPLRGTEYHFEEPFKPIQA